MHVRRVESPGEGVTGLAARSLGDGWRLFQRTPVPRESVADTARVPPRIDDLPVPVPGNVRVALLAAGLIDDPFLAKNDEASAWVSDVEWEYRRVLRVSPWVDKIRDRFPAGGVLHVVFDAVDYAAAFHVDGRPVAHQVGMFSPVDLAIGVGPNSTAPLPGELALRVVFPVQPWWRTHAVKCQMAFGWDFAPEIRTVGLWKPVRTHVTGPAFFARLFLEATPLGDLQPAGTRARVTLRGAVDVVDPATLEPLPGSHRVTLRVQYAGVDEEVPLTVKSSASLEVELPPAEIPWWEPWSVGTPRRVPARVELHHAGRLSDEYRGHVVNRTVSWARNPGSLRDHEDWTLVVNGHKLFLRGINWVPADSLFGRVTPERYQQLVDYALDMHVDILRVWGGGIEEKPAFYDYCDEVGMMVWQEFPFACTNYPRDPRFVAVARRECAGIVQRTRRHPAVVVYCGGNEFNPFINRHLVAIAQSSVRAYNPHLKCFPVSPYGGDDHNWRVWGARRGWDAYDVDGRAFRMLTEYGMQAAPALESLAACYPDAAAPDSDLPSLERVREWLTHHKGDVGLHEFYARRFGEELHDVADLVRVSQTLQAHALKYAIEVCRARWPNVSGVFPWQLNDPWPNLSWSVVDYYLRPKLAYRMLQVAYAPVLPMVRYRRAKAGGTLLEGALVVHNATGQPFHGRVVLSISRKRPDRPTETLVRREYPVRASPDRALRVAPLRVESLPGTVVRLDLLARDGQVVTRNFSFPAMERPASRLQLARDGIDARFDGWWRRHMTKLMVMERLREERAEWERERTRRP